MKVVILAHTPPPMHGQSYMVAQLLSGLRERDLGIECFHVNARLSDDLTEIGVFRISKIFRLLKYCAEAIRFRFREEVDSLYYIPAPPKRGAFYRDCLVLLICRPFFRNLIFHWEASGLAEWVERSAHPWERWMAQRLFLRPELSVTLAVALSHDAEYFRSRRARVVPNAVPDPCPNFESAVLPVQVERLRERCGILDGKEAGQNELVEYGVVFLAHCTREKGLFDSLEAIVLANQYLGANGFALRMRLTVAGKFLRAGERAEFESWQRQHPGEAEYAGFLGEDAKRELLARSDCLCFPTYYSAEAQPVSIIEAMAFGVTIVASAWRGIPELLPPDYPFLMSGRDPALIAQALIGSARADLTRELRKRYLENFTAERYAENLAQAFKTCCADKES